jgi:hypothetical protein
MKMTAVLRGSTPNPPRPGADPKGREGTREGLGVALGLALGLLDEEGILESQRRDNFVILC